MRRAFALVLAACASALVQHRPGAPTGPRRRPPARPSRGLPLPAVAGGIGDSAATRRGGGVEARLVGLSEAATSQFASSVAVAALVGTLEPRFVHDRVLSGSLLGVNSALALAMFFAGSSLARDEVVTTLTRKPKALVGGVFAQFAIMPTLAFVISRCLLRTTDPTEALLAAGVVLVGCSPGGAASNVVALIARANVALSVAMTACSTAAAGVATPLLASALMSASVRVAPRQLYGPLLRTVLAPSLMGVVANETLAVPAVTRAGGDRVAAALCVLGAPFSTALIALIVARVVADARLAAAAVDVSRAALGRLLTALVLLHGGGFALGVAAGKALGLDPPSRRAVSIEVGMQNSALAVVLARSIFGENAAIAALPGALSALTHSLLGGALASLWRQNDAAAAKRFDKRVATENSQAASMRSRRSYVPDGLAVEAYAALKLREADEMAALDLGAWGPRFKRTAPPGAFDKRWLRVFWFGSAEASKKKRP